ncbi:PREDICTED: metalloendoproteinase 1-like [Fragaria vesca subsp. vesca]|uniref:metalloendoproteinase 1-like n=1 Tax=Fragaria vesca subsp. vesca TaxID=101020 RepID=UPI0002C2DDBA|nr:PREDICTED: metalloendoproteinase 1-like [Fragaria vesca subsp. vesca]
MAPKPDLSLFTVTLLLLFLTLFSFLSNATAKEVHSSNNSSPFDFLDHLKCCHKGDKVKGIHDLKKYLHKFGCLDYMNHIHSNDDHFDQFLEEAVRTYQLNFNLNPTGTLDEKTISMMMKPHCGVPDIINGTTSMRSAKIKHQHRAIHTTVHYTLPDGDYKWPPSKYQLTFGFLPGTPSAATGSIVQAFAIWQKSTHFKFSQSNNPQNADLKISFHKRDHGDGDPFDGPGGQLAHAAYPTGGTLHYDAEETWSAGAKPGAMDYGSVGLHEIGHLLGLGHSSVEGAVMFPTVTEGVAYKGLHQDDIQGIKALYKV